MPELHTFLIFAVASAAFLAVPGPSVIYIVSRSLAEGRTAGIVSALGIQAGGLVHVIAATIGVSALLASSATAFSVVKYAGAAYLIYLGIRTAARARRRCRGPRGVGPAQAPVLAGRRRQQPQPEDGAVLPRLPAAVRRPRSRRGRAAGAGARRAVPRAGDAQRLDLRARRGERARLARRAAAHDHPRERRQLRRLGRARGAVAGVELERAGVDAVAQAARLAGSVVEDVAEVAAAGAAQDLRAAHEQRVVGPRLDGGGDGRLGEARPAGAGVELGVEANSSAPQPAQR